jgi:hypothetical protein
MLIITFEREAFDFLCEGRGGCAVVGTGGTASARVATAEEQTDFGPIRGVLKTRDKVEGQFAQCQGGSSSDGVHNLRERNLLIV